ncbi:hypothetical protein DFH94DRAFT_681954 [Russula ochroleuca]|uniref:Uncharacterized protein n=1 Tax=Russula ochroleuca TaxID=152965 RepID=A0A9P5MW48_9AGAM|nr:hypothetical protein DFH94DRAFT_681954 [Russula ochroleuca]
MTGAATIGAVVAGAGAMGGGMGVDDEAMAGIGVVVDEAARDKVVDKAVVGGVVADGRTMVDGAVADWMAVDEAVTDGAAVGEAVMDEAAAVDKAGTDSGTVWDDEGMDEEVVVDDEATGVGGTVGDGAVVGVDEEAGVMTTVWRAATVVAEEVDTVEGGGVGRAGTGKDGDVLRLATKEGELSADDGGGVRGRVRGGEDIERASRTDSEVARELGMAADTDAAFCAARALSLEEFRVGSFLLLIHKGGSIDDKNQTGTRANVITEGRSEENSTALHNWILWAQLQQMSNWG